MTKTMGIALGLFALLSLQGCYNTLNVKNGGLECGPNDSCPDGFACRKDIPNAGELGHCWKDGTGPADAGSGNADTTPSKTDTANPGACPFAGCNSLQPTASSTCDPVCQSECPCGRRCVLDISTYASFLCEATAPSTVLSPVLGPCDGTSTLDCAAGSVCIADDICPWLCFKTCRQDKDCPANSRCSVLTTLDKNGQPVSNVFLCTPPTEGCNPTGSASCSAARTDFNCVFLAGLTGVATSDSTVCDCRTLHNKKPGAVCSMLPDDCQPGAVCVDGTCRQICDKNASGSACPSGGGCNTIYGSARYGYCR
jgi:hypothetical protein